ncbi:hypothetical protein BIW11_07359, partial [Tropilaelaps mercedesae]
KGLTTGALSGGGGAGSVALAGRRLSPVGHLTSGTPQGTPSSLALATAASRLATSPLAALTAVYQDPLLATYVANAALAAQGALPASYAASAARQYAVAQLACAQTQTQPASLPGSQLAAAAAAAVANAGAYSQAAAASVAGNPAAAMYYAAVAAQTSAPVYSGLDPYQHLTSAATNVAAAAVAHNGISALSAGQGYSPLMGGGATGTVSGPSGASPPQSTGSVSSGVSDGLSQQQVEILRRIQQSRTLQQQSALYKNSVRFMPY